MQNLGRVMKSQYFVHWTNEKRFGYRPAAKLSLIAGPET